MFPNLYIYILCKQKLFTKKISILSPKKFPKKIFQLYLMVDIAILIGPKILGSDKISDIPYALLHLKVDPVEASVTIFKVFKFFCKFLMTLFIFN